MLKKNQIYDLNPLSYNCSTTLPDSSQQLNIRSVRFIYIYYRYDQCDYESYLTPSTFRSQKFTKHQIKLPAIKQCFSVENSPQNQKRFYSPKNNIFHYPKNQKLSSLFGYENTQLTQKSIQSNNLFEQLIMPKTNMPTKTEEENAILIKFPCEIEQLESKQCDTHFLEAFPSSLAYANELFEKAQKEIENLKKEKQNLIQGMKDIKSNHEKQLGNCLKQLKSFENKIKKKISSSFIEHFNQKMRNQKQISNFNKEIKGLQELNLELEAREYELEIKLMGRNIFNFNQL